MCELLAVSTSTPIKLTSSLTALSAHAKGVSRDGWGIAFYQGPDVALYKDATSANDAPTVRFLESNGPLSNLSIAYIRHATEGVVKFANTGPYMRELQGRMHVFAHNGSLKDLPPILASGRFHPVGETDSEQAFCHLLERVDQLEHTAKLLPTLELRMDLVVQVAKELRVHGHASFV